MSTEYSAQEWHYTGSLIPESGTDMKKMYNLKALGVVCVIGSVFPEAVKCLSTAYLH